MSFKTNLVIFRVILGKVKTRRFQIYSISWKVVYQHCRTLATFLFENSCCCVLKTLFRDRHYRILNWTKRHMHMYGPGM